MAVSKYAWSGVRPRYSETSVGAALSLVFVGGTIARLLAFSGLMPEALNKFHSNCCQRFGKSVRSLGSPKNTPIAPSMTSADSGMNESRGAAREAAPSSSCGGHWPRSESGKVLRLWNGMEDRRIRPDFCPIYDSRELQIHEQFQCIR